MTEYKTVCGECGMDMDGPDEAEETIYGKCVHCEREQQEREKLAKELEEEMEPAEKRYLHGAGKKSFQHHEDLELEDRREQNKELLQAMHDECDWLDERCAEKIGDDS